MPFLIICWLTPARGLSAASPATNIANTQTLYSSYWTTSGTFQSTAQLHNNLIDEPLTVSPTLYLSDGSSISLSSIVLKALGNASIDINSELATRGWLQPLTGSAAFQYEGKAGGALAAEVSVTDRLKTVAYTIVSSARGAQSASQHTVFWRPSDKAEIYIALQNTSSKEIQIKSTAQLDTSLIPIKPVSLAPFESRVLSLPDDIDSRYAPRGVQIWSESRVGGITLLCDGPPHSLNTSGWIEDEDVGFSTMMNFSSADLPSNTLVGTQILIGNQQRVVSSHLNVKSHLVVRNISPKAIEAHATLSFGDLGQISYRSLPINTFAPFEIKHIDFDELQRRHILPADISIASIKIDYVGTKGALLGRVFGISDDKTLGFYAALESHAPSSIAELYWTTANSTNTLLTVANFGLGNDNITIEITYNGGAFVLSPLSLLPLQQTTLNLADLTTNGTRDQSGSLFPPGVTSGGYRIYGESANSHILVKEHVVDFANKLSAPFYGIPVYITGMQLMDTCPGCLWGFRPLTDILVVSESDDTVPVFNYSDGSQEMLAVDSTWTSTSCLAISTNGSRVSAPGPGGGDCQVRGLSALAVSDEYGTLARFPSTASIRVQVPTALSGPTISPFVNYTNQSLYDCHGRLATTNFYGVAACGYYIVLDQDQQQVRRAGLLVSENITTVDSNTTVQNATGTGTTDANFRLLDFFASGARNGRLPAGSYAYNKQAIYYQPTGRLLRTNCIANLVSIVTVTNMTANPLWPCHH